jgi:hypothetical protein
MSYVLHIQTRLTPLQAHDFELLRRKTSATRAEIARQLICVALTHIVNEGRDLDEKGRYLG